MSMCASHIQRPQGRSGIRHKADTRTPGGSRQRLLGATHLFTGIMPMSAGGKHENQCCFPTLPPTLDRAHPGPGTKSCPRASLTPHFDGHGLLGSDEVDDLFVSAGGDGVAIDPDDLISNLGHKEGRGAGLKQCLPREPSLHSQTRSDSHQPPE